MQDPVTVTELHVLMCIAKLLEPFCLKYQTGQPMMVLDLYNMCHRVMLEFLEKSVIEVADRGHKLTNMALLDATNPKSAFEIDVRFAACCKSSSYKHGERK